MNLEEEVIRKLLLSGQILVMHIHFLTGRKVESGIIPPVAKTLRRIHWHSCTIPVRTAQRNAHARVRARPAL